MNLCEKKRVSANVYSHSVIFKKAGILEGMKKLFFLQRKWGGFLPRSPSANLKGQRPAIYQPRPTAWVPEPFKE